MDSTTIQVPRTLRDKLRLLEAYEREPLWRIITRLMEENKADV